MKILFIKETFPDNNLRFKNFDEAIPLNHYWRSMGTIFFVVIVFVIILQLGIDYSFHVNPDYSLSFLQLLAFLFATLIIHELFHLVFLLKHWNELYFVVQPKTLTIGFVVDDFIKRQEMLAALVFPLFFLSFFPYIAMMVLRRFNMSVFIVVCLNLYISVVDIVMFRFIAKNSNRQALVRFANGFLYTRHTNHNYDISTNQ